MSDRAVSAGANRPAETLRRAFSFTGDPLNTTSLRSLIVPFAMTFLSPRTQSVGIIVLGVGCLSAFWGCGGSTNPETVPVSGSVTYVGAPLTNGKVMFNPVDSKTGRVAHGDIMADGKFTLSTYKDGDGARPGAYNVTIVSYEDKAGGGLAKDKDLGMRINDKSAIPEKYNDPKQSGISITIEAGQPQTDLAFQLVKE